MKVGDYVRTNDGIGKITKYKYEPEYENCHVIWFDNNNYGIRYIDSEIKSTPNIIDLIEVGDYVNGYKVKGFVFSKGKKIGVACDCDFIGFDIDEIKSIVTKEQFESMEYKIGE